MSRAALALALVLAAPPAMADQPIRTPAQKRALIGWCVTGHGADHPAPPHHGPRHDDGTRSMKAGLYQSARQIRHMLDASIDGK